MTVERFFKTEPPPCPECDHKERAPYVGIDWNKAEQKYIWWCTQCGHTWDIEREEEMPK